MTISYVGGNTGTWAGATSGNNNVSLTALTGGSGSSAAIGDIVVAVYATGSAADRALLIQGPAAEAYTLAGTELYANGTTYDTNLRVAYRILTAADANCVFGPTGNNQDAGAAAVHVWRNIDSVTPMDVAVVTATGTATGQPNAASITPTTAGAVVLVCGGAAAITGAAFTQSGSELANFLSVTSADTNDAMVGIGSKAWTSGAFDPVAWTGGTTGAADSWAAVTLALRTGASLFTDSVSEPSTAGATQTVLMAAVASASEPATADSTQASTQSTSAAISEAASAAESQTGAWLTSAATSEAATADTTQAALQGMSGAVSESVSAADTLDSYVIHPDSWYRLRSGAWNAIYWNELGYNTASAPFQTLSDSVSEAVTAAESSTATVVYAAATTEAASAADTPSATFSTVATTSEAATAGESSTTSMSAQAGTSEAASANATQTGAFLAIVAVSEPATADATASGAFLATGSVSEAASASTTQTGAFVALGAVSEPATAAESQAATWATSATISEAATASATQTGAAAFVSVISEAATADANQNGGSLVIGDVSEAVTADSTQLPGIAFTASISESATAAEDSLAGLSYWASTDEPVVVSDNLAAYADLIAAIEEFVNAQATQTVWHVAKYARLTRDSDAAGLMTTVAHGNLTPTYDTARIN